MNTPSFNLQVSYDNAGVPVAAYLRVREGQIAETREIREGSVFADYTAEGVLLGVEMLAPCEDPVLTELAEHETGSFKTFLAEGVQRGLAFR